MSAPGPLRLRPLEIGDILDETFRMYRRHFVLFAGVSVAFAIPLAALAGYGFFSLFNNVFNQAAGGTPTDVTQTTNALVGLGIGYVVVLAIQPLQYGAIIYVICESALGRPVTIGGIVRAALRKYVHVLGFVFLALLMAVAFCLFPLWIWILVGWIALLPAMFVENLGLGGAMGRSWRLVQGRWWRTFLVVLLIVILNYVVTLALDAFLYLGQTLLSVVVSPYLALTLYEVGAIVIQGLTIPVLLIAIVLLYFDLRVRKEAIDLFQIAGRISPALPAAPPA